MWSLCSPAWPCCVRVSNRGRFRTPSILTSFRQTAFSSGPSFDPTSLDQPLKPAASRRELKELADALLNNDPFSVARSAEFDKLPSSQRQRVLFKAQQEAQAKEQFMEEHAWFLKELETQYSEMEELSERVAQTEEWRAYDKEVEEGISQMEDDWLADKGPITGYSNKRFKDNIKAFARKTYRKHKAAINRAQERSRNELLQLNQHADQMAAQITGGQTSDRTSTDPPPDAVSRARHRKEKKIVSFVMGQPAEDER
mmetsp:Transcript_51838/g.130129  ORF Transcript_51838/g.130129 Transcript_51838/m.130129 type:complete len:256 (-) Transcript_51838:1104-1871(-)